MDALKIENYEREHGSGTFPRFRTLSAPESDDVLHCLKNRLRVEADLDALSVLKIIRERSTALGNLNAELDGLHLKYILSGRVVPDRVFLNWHRFNRVDEISVPDLEKSFEYLWYPASDDLEIVHPQLDWILSICHHGSILLLDLV